MNWIEYACTLMDGCACGVNIIFLMDKHFHIMECIIHLLVSQYFISLHAFSELKNLFGSSLLLLKCCRYSLPIQLHCPLQRQPAWNFGSCKWTCRKVFHLSKSSGSLQHVQIFSGNHVLIKSECGKEILWIKETIFCWL